MSCNAYSLRARKMVLKIGMWCALALFSEWQAFALQNVVLTWNPSTNSNVAGYNIYCGTRSHVYTNIIQVGTVTNVTIDNLTEGLTYYFSATSHDSSTNQSPFSNETSYSVPVAVTNTTPTLDAISNLTVDITAAIPNVALTGITSGTTNAKARIKVTAVSSVPSLIRPSISYSSPKNAGKLTFRPTANATGTATITVTVNNGGISNNTVTQSFTITITNAPPTIDPIADLSIPTNAPQQTVNLTGITSGSTNENQKLKVTVVSSNPGLIKPAVKYRTPQTTGSITFKPAANTNGTAIITVTVNDGNLSTETNFMVTVLAGGGAPSDIVQPVAALLTPLGMSNGSFSFQVTGNPGQYVVQGSTDLIHWAPVQTNSIASGANSFNFTDGSASNYAQRFYRVFLVNN